MPPKDTEGHRVCVPASGTLLHRLMRKREEVEEELYKAKKGQRGLVRPEVRKKGARQTKAEASLQAEFDDYAEDVGYAPELPELTPEEEDQLQEELDIPMLDAESAIPADAIIVLVGRPGSGKSFLLRDLMYKLRHKFDLVFGMNPTEESSGTLAPFVPPAFIFKDWDENLLHKMSRFQRLKVASTRHVEKQYYFKHEEMEILRRFQRLAFVADDIMTESNRLNCNAMRDIFMMHRHRKLFMTVGVQYLIDIPRSARNTIDFTFAFYDPSTVNQQNLKQYIFAVYRSFPDFQHDFRVITSIPRNCMVIDNILSKKGLSNPLHAIFRYKADPTPPKFHVGRIGYYTLSRWRERPFEEQLELEDQQEVIRAEVMKTRKEKKQDLVRERMAKYVRQRDRERQGLPPEEEEEEKKEKEEERKKKVSAVNPPKPIQKPPVQNSRHTAARVPSSEAFKRPEKGASTHRRRPGGDSTLRKWKAVVSQHLGGGAPKPVQPVDAVSAGGGSVTHRRQSKKRHQRQPSPHAPRPPSIQPASIQPPPPPPGFGRV